MEPNRAYGEVAP